jgi:hypothetical protein
MRLGLGLGLGKGIMAGKKIVLNPIKDCHVYSWAPDQVYNNNNILIYNGGIGDSHYGLMKFDLSSIIGKEIINAKLKLYAITLADPTVIGIKLITFNWEESVTYNTRPNINSTVHFLESITVGNNAWKTLDIKSLIQAVADGAIYEGLWLYVGNAVSDYRTAEFSSSEGANIPILEITYKDKISTNLVLAECDDIGDLTLQGCVGGLDLVNKVSGTSSIKLTKNADIVGYFIADASCVYDLSSYTKLKFRFYVANNSNIASVAALFFTTTPFDFGINFVKYEAVVSGWNMIEVAFADFTTNGAANWATVKGLRFIINLIADNNTEVVNFDKVEVLK